jgi:phosphoribosylanthranilate isomerase
MSVRVKICGVTRVEDALAAIACGAEIIGLNFYPPSPRFLGRDRAAEIRRAIGGRALVAGVFVNSARGFVAECVSELALDFIQFHGDEDDAMLAGWPVPTIRALRLKSDQALAELPAPRAGYLLLDTFHPGLYGGSGQPRALDGLQRFDLSRVILSGGLDPANVAAAAALGPYAVDVASGVESAPGIKDPSRLRSFISNAKSAR